MPKGDAKEDKQILHMVSQAKEAFGTRCRKFTGALTVEVIAKHLRGHGIPTSPRDVYIRGLAIEIDLLIPRSSAAPRHGLLYEPDDVLGVLEVKSLGSFGKSTVDGVRRTFKRLKELRRGIYCAYVTLEERKTYKWAPTTATLGFDCYTLFWHRGSGPKMVRESTGDWPKLIRRLRDLVRE